MQEQSTGFLKIPSCLYGFVNESTSTGLTASGRTVIHFFGIKCRLICRVKTVLIDFLTMTEGYYEKELKDAFMNDISDFLLELGKGFACVQK